MLLKEFAGAAARHRHDRRVMARGTDAFDKPGAVHTRHIHIADNHIKSIRVGGEQIPRFDAVSCAGDLVAALGKARGQDLQNRVIVIDQ